jgi:hypothetical protein
MSRSLLAPGLADLIAPYTGRVADVHVPFRNPSRSELLFGGGPASVIGATRSGGMGFAHSVA